MRRVPTTNTTVTAIGLLACALAIGAPAGAEPQAKPAAKPAPRAAAPSGVDTVIALVKGGMSEALVIKPLRAEGKTYTRTPADLWRLRAAGVGEPIMHAMTEPKSGAASAAAAPAASAAPAAA